MYDVLISPDFSLYVEDMLEVQNMYNVYRTRFVTAYWQHCGYQVIPTVSWGNPDSFHFCFEGLPTDSVIAVCGTGHEKSEKAHRLWCYGITELVKRKNPLKILVYGGRPCIIEGVNTEMVFMQDFINKRFRK